MQTITVLPFTVLVVLVTVAPDPLVVATEWGLRFVDAGQVELITVRHVRSRLDDEQAARLAPPQGTVVYSVSAMDEIGEALDERLGQMFGRPHWTTG